MINFMVRERIMVRFDHGNVEKSRQRRSRHFAVLTYYEYAPRVKMAAALPVEGRVLARLGWAGQTTDFFEHSLPLTMRGSPGAFIGYWSKIFNRPIICWGK